MMSALGQKQTYAVQNVMSALPPEGGHLCLRFRPVPTGKALPAGQDDPDFGELAWLRMDLDRAAMLLDDDVVTYGEAKAGPFFCRFRCEEGIERLLFHLG